MEKILPELIRDNENLRQVLLAQEGGIMKYWAEHPDVDGLEALYRGYREQCTYDYREEHKWDGMSEDMMKREALAEDHIKKELVYMEALKLVLSISFAEVADQSIRYIEDYLDFAFIEWQRSLYPKGISPLNPTLTPIFLFPCCHRRSSVLDYFTVYYKLLFLVLPLFQLVGY